MLRLILLTLLAFCSLLGQSPRAVLAQLNGEASRLSRRGTEAEVRQLLQRRQGLLEEVGDASLALPPGISRQIARRFPDLAILLEQRGKMTGVLEVEYEDGEPGEQGRELKHLRVGPQRYRVKFNGRSGAMYTVDGLLVGDSMIAESVEESDAGEQCSTTGEQRIAVIKIRPPGASDNTLNGPIADSLFSNEANSIDGFWKESSGGKAWASGDVYPADGGWYEYDRAYSCTESSQMYSQAMQAANNDINFRNYQRVVIVTPKPSGCSFAGRASIGCWVPNPDGGSSVSYAILTNYHTRSAGSKIQLAAHELAHSLGLNHAGSVDFGAEALGAPNTTGVISEYGDRYAAEGLWDTGHYTAQHKAALGWTQVRSINDSGNYTLAPFEGSTGDRALLVERGSQKLWIEYRRRLGSYNAEPPGNNGYNGALIRLDTGGTTRSQLLDFTPETGSVLDSALLTGKRWDDPHTDLSIAIGEATDSGLALTISYGVEPLCVPALPDISLAPASQSVVEGATASYQLTLRNRDADCGPSTWSLSSPGRLSVTSLTLNAGQSSTATVFVDATATGTLPVSAQAVRSGETATATAILTVTPKPCVTAAPTLTLAPANWESEYPAPASFTATIQNNDAASCAERTFSIVFSGPTIPEETTANLAPSATNTINLTATPPQPGQYTVTAESGGTSATAQFTSSPPACSPAADVETLSATPDGYRLTVLITGCNQ